MELLSFSGHGGTVWLAAGACLAVARKISFLNLIRLVLAIVAATVITDDTLKPLIHRTRPFDELANRATHVEVLGDRPEDASFPSGHTSNAFASAWVLSSAMPGVSVVWWLLAAAIGFSRIYVGVHYPIDVVGGAIVGCLCGALVMRATRGMTLTNRCERLS